MWEFGSPVFLWLLLLVPFVAMRALRRQKQRSGAVRFSDLRLAGSVRAGWAIRVRRWLPWLEVLALALMIVALARPRFGTVQRDVTGQGVDLFYALDISGSMRAEDFRPNRLERAKQLTAHFAMQRQNDRQGVVLFAGQTFTLCPLTFDAPTVRDFLQHVDFAPEEADGTAIGMGLARALRKLRESEAKSRVVILMTDGENNAGEISPEQATSIAKKMGVKVYTIGIGSEGFAVATIQTRLGPRRQRIRTSIDEDLLREIASQTGGMYRRATSGRELESILEEIDALEKSEIEMKEYRTYDERMAVFCWPALLLLLGHAGLANTRFMKVP